MTDSETALLLIAHGSRRAEANADLVKLAKMIQTREPTAIVEIAYLELTEPDIPQGAAACVQRGASEIRMVPYFLSAGQHVVRDLQGFQAEFRETWPNVTITLCPPLGLHPAIVDVVLERMTETYLAG
jgi:sirohydrochlorin ferrochelatase